MAYTKDEWWNTNTEGKRIGWVKPGEFTRRVVELFGVKGTHYQAPLMQFAEWVGVGKSTAYRWALGQDPIPKWVAVLLALDSISERDLKARPLMVEANWLPFSGGANGRQRPVEPPDGGTDKQQPGHAHAIVTSPTHNVRWPKDVTP